jgi:molybdenum cofactor biosynthesis enzyme MoaA
LCVKTYFRNSENIENLINGTRNLKCFSCIPESTRRVLLNRCSFEEWPSGALILCTLFGLIEIFVLAPDTVSQQLFPVSHECAL